MRKAHTPDFFIKSSISTTDAWGFFQEPERPHSQNSVSYRTIQISSARTVTERVFQNKLLSCNKNYWRDICIDHSIKDSLTNEASMADIHDSLANFETAANFLYHFESIHQGRLASVYAVFFVEKNYSARNLDAINSLLLDISPKRLTEWSMVALLRSSYSARHLLPAWGTFLRSVQKAMEGNDRAPRLLAGLED